MTPFSSISMLIRKTGRIMNNEKNYPCFEVKNHPSYHIVYVLFPIIFGIFLLIPSMFLLSNISDNGILAVQNKGFICLYLYIIFAIVFVYYNIGLNIITWIIADPEHLELFSSWKTALPPILIIMPLCACFLVLVLVHLKLGKYHGIPWTLASVPLWIFVVLEMFCRIHQLFYVLLKHLSLPKLIGFTAACGSLGIITVLPLTLMGYAYDYLPDPAQYWKYCTMFYYPHLSVLSLLTIYLLFDHIRLWIKYSCHGTDFDWARKEYLPIDLEVFKSRVIIGFVALFHCVVACVVLYTLFLSL
jgi:hypothetical protein